MIDSVKETASVFTCNKIANLTLLSSYERPRVEI